MKKLNTTHMILDLTPAIPLLDALEVAQSFPDLFVYCQYHDTDHLLDEAMETINEYCPWLWPAIDNAVLSIIQGQHV